MRTWLVILFRSIFIFFIVLILIRVMRKRNIWKLTPMNFINYTVIAIIASLISLNIIRNFIFGLIALGVWVLLPIILDFLCMKSKWIHDVINGKERVLIKNGKIMEENLSEIRYTGEELIRDLRSKNVFNLADVEFAIMETTGDINVSLKSEKKPITAKELGVKVSPRLQAQTVILDGNIINDGLANMGLNQAWLKAQLEGKRIALENVFIGQIDSSGDLYLDLFDDNIEVPQPNVKELLYANIEKIQGDIMSFALETDDENVKAMYLKNAEALNKVMKKLESYLLR